MAPSEDQDTTLSRAASYEDIAGRNTIGTVREREADRASLDALDHRWGSAHAADGGGIGYHRVPRRRQHLRQAWVVSGPLSQTALGTGDPSTTLAAAWVPSLVFAVLSVNTDTRHSASFARWIPPNCCSELERPIPHGSSPTGISLARLCGCATTFKPGPNHV